MKDITYGHEITEESIPAKLKREESLQSNIVDVMAQAYIVIGNITGTLDVWTPEIETALNYFSGGKYDDDFLPWDMGDAETPENWRNKMSDLDKARTIICREAAACVTGEDMPSDCAEDYGKKVPVWILSVFTRILESQRLRGIRLKQAYDILGKLNRAPEPPNNTAEIKAKELEIRENIARVEKE